VCRDRGTGGAPWGAISHALQRLQQVCLRVLGSRLLAAVCPFVNARGARGAAVHVERQDPAACVAPRPLCRRRRSFFRCFRCCCCCCWRRRRPCARHQGRAQDVCTEMLVSAVHACIRLVRTSARNSDGTRRAACAPRSPRHPALHARCRAAPRRSVHRAPTCLLLLALPHPAFRRRATLRRPGPEHTQGQRTKNLVNFSTHELSPTNSTAHGVQFLPD
jgi:hypothetical protein